MREFMSLSSSEAMRLVEAATHTASEDGGKPIAICVLDVRGTQLAAVCMDGASEANVRTAHAKAKAVLEFQRDTRDFRFNRDGSAKESGWPEHHVVNALGINPEFCSFSGGVSVRQRFGAAGNNGPIIGAIAVSGRDELDDHKVAEQAIYSVFD